MIVLNSLLAHAGHDHAEEAATRSITNASLIIPVSFITVVLVLVALWFLSKPEAANIPKKGKTKQ